MREILDGVTRANGSTFEMEISGVSLGIGGEAVGHELVNAVNLRQLTRLSLRDMP